MAVSLNMSMSRSDFMISDAAIPMRMEELELEQQRQSGEFADILSGIGVQTAYAESEPADAEAMKIIQAIADGEMTAEDVSAEPLSENVFKRIAELLKLKIGDFDDDSEDMQNAAAELAALFMAQPEAVADDKSAELSELTGAAVEAVGAEIAVKAAEMPQEEAARDTLAGELTERFTQEQPEAPAKTAEQTVPTAEQESRTAQASQTAQVSQTEQANQTEQASRTAQVSRTEQVSQTAQADRTEAEAKPAEKAEAKRTQNVQPKAEPQTAEQEDELPVRMDEQAESGSFKQTMRHSEAPAQIRAERAEQSGQPGQKLFESAELTVTEREEQPEAEARTELPAARSAAASERVVEKSDELMMLKNAVKRMSADEGAQLIRADAAVNVPRSETPEVKPAEVLGQVEVKLTELVEQAKQGATEYMLTLEPEELGKITVKMTKASDGTVSVSVAAENSRTQRILEENGAMLQSTLKQHGIQLESWQTVNESQQDMHAEDYRGSRGNQYRGEERRENAEPDEGESFSDIIANM